MLVDARKPELQVFLFFLRTLCCKMIKLNCIGRLRRVQEVKEKGTRYQDEHGGMFTWLDT